MTFLISDTFVDSLTRLAAADQKAAKLAAYELQINPAHPSLKLHRIERAHDGGFWSVRAGRDVRLIVHRSDDAFVLCYADHHDRAYAWASRRRLERHPATGAAQLVELRETVREIVVPRVVPDTSAAPPCAGRSDDELLGWGIPADWIADVREADEDALLRIAERLPPDAAEALLDLATGVTPRRREAAPPDSDGFTHPDARRAFRVISGGEELERALEYPWDRWIVFLHPDQRGSVEATYKGPARVSGSTGTGKTIVALHRAVFLARRDEDSRVLLATFSDSLARALDTKLRRLIGNEPRVRERIEVASLDSIVLRMERARLRDVRIADSAEVEQIIAEAREDVLDEHERSRSYATTRFLTNEWERVVAARRLVTWEGYRDAPRLGRKTRLPESRRAVAWRVFERVRAMLADRGLVTISDVFYYSADRYQAADRHQTAESEKPSEVASPWSHILIDEAQDLSIPQLRFLAALRGDAPDGLFFAGDIAQRIFREPFSWASLGVDVRGRSRILRVNYRTSHEIRSTADRLLDPQITDPDGTSERRDGTISVFAGPAPRIDLFENDAAEVEAVAAWLRERVDVGVEPREIGVFVRSEGQLDRARQAVALAGLSKGASAVGPQPPTGAEDKALAPALMHDAKGLEFRAVAVMACDEDVIPSPERIERIGDEADLEEVYTTERNLLYVAATRAREILLVTGVRPGSEFLDDLRG